MRASTDTLMNSEPLPSPSCDDTVRLNREQASQACSRHRLCFSWHEATD
jgi:hypothetical protein